MEINRENLYNYDSYRNDYPSKKSRIMLSEKSSITKFISNDNPFSKIESSAFFIKNMDGYTKLLREKYIRKK
jgi:hypothetical protein